MRPLKKGKGSAAIEARFDAIIRAIFVNAQDADTVIAEEQLGALHLHALRGHDGRCDLQQRIGKPDLTIKLDKPRSKRVCARSDRRKEARCHECLEVTIGGGPRGSLLLDQRFRRPNRLGLSEKIIC